LFAGGISPAVAIASRSMRKAISCAAGSFGLARSISAGAGKCSTTR
jgi:hypothetical protein